VNLGFKNGGFPGFLAADMNTQGEFVIGWATDGVVDAAQRLVSQRFSANGVLKGTHRRPGCNQGSFPCYIAVALDDDDNALLAGQGTGNSSNYDGDHVAVFSPSGALGLPAFIGEAKVTGFFGDSIASGPAGSFIYAGVRVTGTNTVEFYDYLRIAAQVFSAH
jgi:hypothetical protein